MKSKNVLLLLLLLILISEAWAQRRSTSVRGYTRKDGTYVRPHTRSYTAGSSSYSSYPSSYSAANESDDSEPYDTIALTKLVIVQNIDKNYTTQDLKVNSNRSLPIIPTSLVVNEALPVASSTSEFHNNKVVADDVVIYVSVLRYNSKPIDICPIGRKYGEEWDFDNIQHHFNKTTISAEQALELVADYGWKIENSRLSRSFSYERYAKSKFPKYLTRTIEAIKLQ